MAAIEKYLAPQTLAEATRIVAETDAHLLAGGTDLLLRRAKGLVPEFPKAVDLKRVADLNGIACVNGEIRVGACTLLSEIASDAFIRQAAPVLAQAADRVACPQIRNRATVGGNLCNASPAADTAVPLILLDAVLDLASSAATGGGRCAVRSVPIADFFRGPGATVLAPGEILTTVRFRPLPDRTFAAWDKLGTRRAMEIAVASVGALLRVEAGTVAHARVAYGSVAPTPLRGRQAEEILLGNPLSAETIGKCSAAARDEISPISDVRASAAYRRNVVAVMLMRMLERASCN